MQQLDLSNWLEYLNTIIVSRLLFDIIPTAWSRINTYLLACVSLACALLIFAAIPGYDVTVLFVVVILSSVFSSFCYSQATTTTLLLVPPAQLPEAVGFVRFFQGLGVLLGPYLTG